MPSGIVEYTNGMSFRAWISAITLLLVGVILYFARSELYHAWTLLGQVNIWILALLLPMQLFTYYCAGEMTFSYLRAKRAIDDVSPWEQTKIALEMNFVNHVMPSGGVSGISYTSWRLSKLGISAGKATMAQLVRYAMQFSAFIILLAISVLLVTIDGNVSRWVILMSSSLVSLMLGTILGGIYLFSSQSRMSKTSAWLVKVVNPLIRQMTFGKVLNLIKQEAADEFMEDIHNDYIELRKDRKVLFKPLAWGLLFTAVDAMMFYVVFLALGEVINPAPILIAYGVAVFTSMIVVTPGGTGAFEIVMAAFLAFAGVANSAAIAGIVLTRVIVLIGTIGFGYIFYQQAIVKHGKGRSEPDTNTQR